MVTITSTKHTNKTVKVLCYGDSGTGKTVLCGTAPKPIILSAEAGLLSLSGQDIPVIEVGGASDVNDAYRFFTESADAGQYHTICLDSVSDIAERLLSEYKQVEKDPRQAYGRMQDEMTTIIRSFRDLPNFSVYFTAKLVSKEDEGTGITMNRPDAPGNMLKKDLPFFFDEVMALRIGKTPEGVKYRYLQTQPEVQWIAKDRSGKLDDMEKPDLTNIFRKILTK